MFHYFEDNYGWSLSVQMAISMGGEISEIESICAPLRPLAVENDAQEMAWFDSWSACARKLVGFGRSDEAAGHPLTASRKLLRASLYMFIAERQVVHKNDVTQQTYADAVALFKHACDIGGRNMTPVEVPFQGTSLPALWLPAPGTGPKPTIVHFGGLDVNKELIYLWRIFEANDRGLNVLIIDHPGLGEAVRFRNLYASHAMEPAGTAAYDYVAARPDVDPDAVAIMGVSLGGYYAPRVAAFEPRYAACILWGAIWSMNELYDWVFAQERPATSVPLDEQFAFVMGAPSPQEARRRLEDWTLEPVMDRVTCPILVAHGAHDEQAPPFLATKTYEAAVNSSRRELRMFTLAEGGAEHCQIDVSSIGTDFMLDWAAEVLGASARVNVTLG